ncbi:hypothetical protein OG2516_05718 [Oceanicola granulosus HTCC2516]|uniref:Polysaccharide biosynthesis protein n=1 Tax=Oceanicola granulosus (strain ATCC BAA-861 / DSM 15982 / KCTC 12143 / HTCC2516) TaxID=314256 RepID=Q2CIK8_OCEGH|nr:hypothetical protein [Oceanicola granulosus]EAR52581.1 hypothetical protein OG2516_05718 [Oceanicola granulosus HTCC2516]
MTKRAGIAGAFAYSGANFLLALTLQSAVPPAAFGRYAFALVCLQLGLSLSNALFASPLLQSLLKAADPAPIVASYWRVNVAFCFVGAALLALSMRALGMAPQDVALVAGQAVLLWMRWFFRAAALARHRFRKAATADALYGVTTLTAGILLFTYFGVTVATALAAMALGTAVSLAAVAHLPARGPAAPSLYRAAFMRHGRWALAGVLTTEVCANLHAYAITLLLGPAAFAPVAILTLFLRPIPILMQTITQYERPILAKAHAAGELHNLRAHVERVRTALLGAVGVNGAVLILLIAVAPGSIGGGRFEAGELWPLASLLLLAHAARAARTGSGAALQGAGRYRALSGITLRAALVTACGTALALGSGGAAVPLILLAVLCGETVAALLIARAYRRLAVAA